jgi:hypothetical protein
VGARERLPILRDLERDARGDEGREGWCIFGGGWREYLQRATLWQPMPTPPRTNEYGESA